MSKVLKGIGKYAAPFAGLALAPFTGGMSALASGLLKGGATVGGNLLSSYLSSKGNKPQQPSVKGGVDSQTQSLMDTAKTLTPLGTDIINQARGAFTPAQDYWTRILTGDRQAATAALSPEINRISTGYDAAARSTQALTPRGGGRSAFMTELPFRRAGEVTSLLNTSRPQAATSLASVGGQLGGLGLGTLGAGTGASRSLLDYYTNQRQMDLTKRGQNIDIGKGIGGGLFDLLKKYGPQIFGKIKGKSGGGAPSIPDYGAGGPY